MNNKGSQFGFAYGDTVLVVERQRALEFDDIGEGDMGYTRDDILSSIQHLLLGSFEFGFNPLPNLRKYFPRLNWEYHCFDKIEDNDKKFKSSMRRMIASCDFFWPVHAGSGSYWITASRKDTVPARMRIFGRGDIGFVYKYEPEQIEFLKDAGVTNLFEGVDYALPLRS